MNLPEVVSQEQFDAAREPLLTREKEHTRAGDALAAERRSLPMVAVEKDYVFEGPDGERSLLDLFDGRRQLILYRHFFDPDMERYPEAGCGGCAMFTDNVGELAHLHARDTSFVLASGGAQEHIRPYRERMGWDIPWYTTRDDFSADHDADQYFGLFVFIRDDEGNVFRTYSTTGRSVEAIGQVWSLLDLTPLGRQETWEETPEGRPQTKPYGWWRLHDEYDD